MPQAQVITFPTIPDQSLYVNGYNLPPNQNSLYAAPGSLKVPLTAKASSGLPITYKVLSGAATIEEDTLSIIGAGKCVVEATQPGDTNWNAAVAVKQTFSVAPSIAIPTFNQGATSTVLNNQALAVGLVSQSIGLHSLNAETNLAVSVQFSGDPGAVEIALQTSDVDTPNDYVTVSSLDNTDINVSFVGRFQVSVIARYARLIVVTATNPVNVTVTVT